MTEVIKSRNKVAPPDCIETSAKKTEKEMSAGKDSGSEQKDEENATSDDSIDEIDSYDPVLARLNSASIVDLVEANGLNVVQRQAEDAVRFTALGNNDGFIMEQVDLEDNDDECERLSLNNSEEVQIISGTTDPLLKQRGGTLIHVRAQRKLVKMMKLLIENIC